MTNCDRNRYLIRQGQPAELMSARNVVEECWDEMYRASVPSTVLERMIGRLRADERPTLLAPGFGESIFVALDSSQVVGTVIVRSMRAALVVQHLYVGRAWRGQGIGRRLMVHVSERHPEGLCRVQTLRSGSATAFYKSLGFVEIGQRRLAMDGTFALDVIDMQASLPLPPTAIANPQRRTGIVAPSAPAVGGLRPSPEMLPARISDYLASVREMAERASPTARGMLRELRWIADGLARGQLTAPLAIQHFPGCRACAPHSEFDDIAPETWMARIALFHIVFDFVEQRPPQGGPKSAPDVR